MTTTQLTKFWNEDKSEKTPTQLQKLCEETIQQLLQQDNFINQGEKKPRTTINPKTT